MLICQVKNNSFPNGGVYVGNTKLLTRQFKSKQQQKQEKMDCTSCGCLALEFPQDELILLTKKALNSKEGNFP